MKNIGSSTIHCIFFLRIIKPCICAVHQKAYTYCEKNIWENIVGQDKVSNYIFSEHTLSAFSGNNVGLYYYVCFHLGVVL